MAPPTLERVLKDVERESRLAQFQQIPDVPMPGIIRVFFPVIAAFLIGGLTWMIWQFV